MENIAISNLISINTKLIDILKNEEVLETEFKFLDSKQLQKLKDLSAINIRIIYDLLDRCNKLLLKENLKLSDNLLKIKDLEKHGNISDYTNFKKVYIYKDAIKKLNEYALTTLKHIKDRKFTKVYLFDIPNILYGHNHKTITEHIIPYLIDYDTFIQKISIIDQTVYKLCVYNNYTKQYSSGYNVKPLNDSKIKSVYQITIPTKLNDQHEPTTNELDDVFILLLTYHLKKDNSPVQIISNDKYSAKRYNNFCFSDNGYIPCQSDILSAIRVVVPDILNYIVKQNGNVGQDLISETKYEENDKYFDLVACAYQR
jgi:hypothetical protein